MPVANFPRFFKEKDTVQKIYQLFLWLSFAFYVVYLS